MLHSYNFDLIKDLVVTEEDKQNFAKIDIVVNTLQQKFSNFTREYIIDALKANSLNLKNTYFYLKNPEAMKGNDIF